MNLDQEKRVMLAFALSIVMLILYRVYFVKEQPPEPKKAAPVAATTPAGPPGAPKTTATSAAAPAAAACTRGTAGIARREARRHRGGKQALPRDLFHPGGSGQELGAEELSRRKGPTARYRQRSGM